MTTALALTPAPVPERVAHAAPPCPPEAEERIYAELQVLARRLERLYAVVAPIAACDPDPAGPWPRCADLVAATRRALRGAAVTLPVPPLAAVEGPSVLLVGELRLAVRSRRAEYAGRSLALTPKEFDLLVRLAWEPAVVVRKRELLRDVWGWSTSPATRTVDSHASRVRRALVRAGAGEGDWIVNHWGLGYSLTRVALPPSLAVEEAAA